MPYSPQHKRQRGKNIALLAVLLGLMALLYLITIVRFVPNL